MGSSYFYLEVLLIWVSLLKSAGFKYPAIFALDYTLVPDKSYPVQLHQTIAGYNYVCSRISSPSDICVSGDSAGATLVLSLLLHLGQKKNKPTPNGSMLSRNDNTRPGMAVLISPWVNLLSTGNRDTSSDYLNENTLQLYAHQYGNNKTSLHDPHISPGNGRDASWWQNASPEKGFYVSYGSEEAFAPEIKDLVLFWKDTGVAVECCEEKGGIHAWPIARTFLSRMHQIFLQTCACLWSIKH
jgi:acetyl esterase/lipase